MTEDGYEFYGWRDAGGNEYTCDDTMPAFALSVTGRWEVAEVSYRIITNEPGDTPQVLIASLATALAAASNMSSTSSAEITLIKDLTISENYEIPANVSLSGAYAVYDEPSDTWTYSNSGITGTGSASLTLNQNVNVSGTEFINCPIIVLQDAAVEMTGCSFSGYTAAAITNHGTLHMESDVFDDCMAADSTAKKVIESDGTLLMKACSVDGNDCIGVYVSGGKAYIIESTVMGNVAANSLSGFAGIYAKRGAEVHVLYSTVTGNTKVVAGITASCDIGGESGSNVYTYRCAIGRVSGGFTVTDEGSNTGCTDEDGRPTNVMVSLMYMEGEIQRLSYMADAYDDFGNPMGTREFTICSKSPGMMNSYSVTHVLTQITATQDTAGDGKANLGIMYSTTLTASTGYSRPSSIVVVISGVEAVAGTDYTYDSNSGMITISGEKVTGAITITAVAKVTLGEWADDVVDSSLRVDTNRGYMSIDSSECTDFSQLVSLNTGYTSMVTPSDAHGWLGTGSMIQIMDSQGMPMQHYTLIVTGDVTGDSVCDALDVLICELAMNGQTTLSGANYDAAALVDAGSANIDIYDFQAIMNMAVGGAS